METKTPEQLAEEYAKGMYDNVTRYNAFLAGHIAATRVQVEAAWEEGMLLECQSANPAERLSDGWVTMVIKPQWQWDKTEYRIAPGQFAALNVELTSLRAQIMLDTGNIKRMQKEGARLEVENKELRAELTEANNKLATVYLGTI